MDINEVCRGVVYRDQEANKEHLTGGLRIVVEYSEGKIVSARYEKTGRLIPGTRKDPGKPFESDGKNHHGG